MVDRLRQMLRESEVDVPAIEAYLDGLDGDARIAEVTGLGRREQRRLYAAAEGHRVLRVSDLVPTSTAPLTEVVFEGCNTLPAFTRFAKVLCRPDSASDPEAAAAGELWGYNRNSNFVETVVGPGFFVAADHGESEVLVDYLRVPPRRPDHWPPIRENHTRLSFFVYNGTQDVLRGVSEHVSIGRASRRGRLMNIWFVLCRAD
ncbi:MAG: hypothetical protein DRJ42_10070 [Deltaproteobacteria bacterium]|nr:MAG: hypothetical protein DRJ42_10070 [Deltaproteobacteria bacterium]